MIDVHPSNHSFSLNSKNPLFCFSLEEELPSHFILNQKIVKFKLDDYNQKIVECENRTCATVAEAINQINPNRILHHSDLGKWSILINFLINGNHYHLIEDIEKFKEDYETKLEKQELNPSYLLTPLLSRYKIEVIELPSFNQLHDQLTFYVHKELTPYRVRVFHFLKGTPHVYVQQLEFCS